jgi:hypothetical protein
VFAFIRVEDREPRILEKFDGRSNGGHDDRESYRATMMALVKSRVVLAAALRPAKIEELKIIKSQKVPVGWLEANLLVEKTDSSEVIRIGLPGRDPELVTLVDSIVSSFMEEVLMSDRKAKEDRLDALRVQAGLFEERLRVKRRTMKELADAAGSTGLSHELAREWTATLIRERTRLRIDSMKNRARLSVLEAEAKLENPRSDKTSVTVADLKREIGTQEELGKLLDVETAKTSTGSIVVNLEDARDEIDEKYARRLRDQTTAAEIELNARPHVSLWDRAAIY